MNNKISILVILLVAVIAAAFFFLSKVPSNSTTDADKPSVPDGLVSSDSVTPATNTLPTIGTQWQWREGDEMREQSKQDSEAGESLPFTPQSVYDALQAVRLDDEGNVIKDHDALISLDEALERIHNKLDDESLRALQDLIKDALPGMAGEQTAQLVGDYQQFLGAQQEFNQIHQGSAAAVQSLESLQNDEALYTELQALREVYLGRETTNSLFRQSDANAQFMFDNLKLEHDNSLTPQERQTRRQEIEARLKEQTE